MFRETEGACIRRVWEGGEDTDAARLAAGLAMETHWTRTLYVDLFSAVEPTEHGVVAWSLLDLLQAVGHAGRRVASAWRAWREARELRTALTRLDARTLRDLGLEQEGLHVCHWNGIDRLADASAPTGHPFGLPFTERL